MKSFITKISLKPSLIVLCAFALGYISLFLPGTKIQYQIIMGKNTTSEKIITGEGLVSAFFTNHYRDGTDALPCRFARMESIPSSTFKNLLLVWEFIVKVPTLMLLYSGISYATRNKMPLPIFLMLTLTLMLGPVLILLTFFNNPEVMCSENDFYKIITFTPYWLPIPFLVAGIFLLYVVTRATNSSKISVATI